MKSLRLVAVQVAIQGASLVFLSLPCLAQEEANKQRMKEMREIGARVGQLYRAAHSSADKLELTPDQKKELLIIMQKHQDAIRKVSRGGLGGQANLKKHSELSKKLMEDSESVLTKKQKEKLNELAKNQNARKNYSPEQAKEMQRLNMLMSELMRVSYDQKLIKELEITAEQRVEIRDIQREFQMAMQERMKKAQQGEFDMDSYSATVGDMMVRAQSILTAEQSEKLTRGAKLRHHRQTYGDPFAMINGIAQEFELEPKEAAELRETIQDAQDDYYEKLSELQESTLDKIIKKLPLEHRDDVRESVRGFFDEDPREKARGFGNAITVGN